MKEGWGNQISPELSKVVERVSTRERFSTSHIARNPLKLPEIEVDNEDYLSMIKNPLAVGFVRLYVEPGSIDTSFGGLMAETLQGVQRLP